MTLRIAVPNKGILSDAATQMLSEAGYTVRRDSKELTVFDGANDAEFFYLRPRDIATYVGSGSLDVGITGRDLLVDSGSTALEVAGLEFGASTFRFAGPAGRFSAISDLNGARIATSYAGIVSKFLTENGITAELVELDGAVESAIKLGVADVVADVVSTGTTLRQQGLDTFGPVVLESTAVLISARANMPGLETFQRRLQGVLVARKYVLMDYDLPAELVPQASAITPGLESPTVSPLRDTGWVAVRVMVPAGDTNRLMDQLYELGARAILVSAIHAARI